MPMKETNQTKTEEQSRSNRYKNFRKGEKKKFHSMGERAQKSASNILLLNS